MKNKIHYSPESRRDLDDIWDYIVLELQNRSAAERVIDRIMDAVDQLKNFEEMGTPLSSIADVGTGYRFLVSGNYMVFYRVQGNDVYIDRVLYGRSDYMSVLFKDMLCKETKTTSPV
jgi:toxin ParE1/3/4